MAVKKSEWSQLFVANLLCIRRESLQTDLLSSYDAADDDDQNDDDDGVKVD